MSDDKKNEIRVPLEYPVTVTRKVRDKEVPGGFKDEPTTYHELVFSGRLKTKHMMASVSDVSALEDGVSGPQFMRIVASWAGVSIDVIEELDGSDWGAVMETVGPFMQDSQKTGTKLSGG